MKATLYITRGNSDITVDVEGRYTNYTGIDAEMFGNGFEDITATVTEIEDDGSMPHTLAIGCEIELTREEEGKAQEALSYAMQAERRELCEY